ncbi:hypothetical protein COLO4_34105 [Corchorus olitorius]|uniref:Uncharacterized protein n=1 Tax=Corchorus olitorius TaxID=93759 RepID=A0A1R3GNN5_9ROSI|nr:hypothetical protein COLO4_34105 [Corchorus olitorius]
MGGGITRLKEHLAGILGNVGYCIKARSDVQWQMKELLADLRKEQARRKKLRDEIGNPYGDYLLSDQEDEEHNITSPTSVGSKKAKEKVDANESN